MYVRDCLNRAEIKLTRVVVLADGKQSCTWLDKTVYFIDADVWVMCLNHCLPSQSLAAVLKHCIVGVLVGCNPPNGFCIPLLLIPISSIFRSGFCVLPRN